MTRLASARSKAEATLFQQASVEDLSARFAGRAESFANAFRMTSVQAMAETPIFSISRPTTVARFGSPEAFPVDGVGDGGKNPFAPLLVVTTDDVPDSITGSNPELVVDAAVHRVSTLDHIADQDFYKVTLTAGVTYEIYQYAKAGGPSGTPLPDSYLELYDSAGNLITAADGGGQTPGGQIYGTDAGITFVPEVTGTYYINARSFDNSDADGSDKGDTVGDYEIFVNTTAYVPYYNLDSPLNAIDWGTQVNKMHQSVRNPDGDEGPRDTGNAHGITNYSDATALQSLATAQGKGDITGKNVITVYFAKAGEVYVDDDPTTNGTTETMVAKGFQAWEISAYKYAFAAYEKVADIVYLVVDNVYDVTTHTAGADFTFLTYEGTPGSAGTPSLLGRMSPPDTDNEGQSEFNGNDIRWTQNGLAPGGFSFTTLIHEMGHGHGLAHPHDNGGHSSIMRGVHPESQTSVADYTNGDFDLNQSVYTMMSYEDGWEKSPYGQAKTTDPYGWLKGLMAFDIAVIQDKYGVNEDTGAGDDVYILEDTNHGTTFDANNNIVQFASGFSSIWDAGGTDRIEYVGSRNANIDLREASLKYEYGGGGWISYAYGVYGGFTIASGAVIENAKSDAGNDILTGNGVNNRLESGAGNDQIFAQYGGDDTIIAGSGDDIIYYGAALTLTDNNDGGAGARDVLVLQGNYTMTFNAQVMANIEFLSLQSGSVTKFGDTAGNLYDYNITLIDANAAAGQQLVINAQSLLAGEDFTFNGSAETDGKYLIYAGAGVDNLTGGSGNDIFFFEGNRWGASDRVNGGGGLDSVVITGVNGMNNITIGNDVLDNVESISINARFASDPSAVPSYNVVLGNNNASNGALIVNASSLAAGQTFAIDASAVTDGNLTIYGGAGADTLKGGTLGDTINGGLGADSLTGGGGNDAFQYRSTAESTTASADSILDFTTGDKIDLSRIDAIAGTAQDDGFTFIGSGAFTNQAGQLRAENVGGTWVIQGDVNGDGVADLQINVTVSDAHPITGADFVL